LSYLLRQIVAYFIPKRLGDHHILIGSSSANNDNLVYFFYCTMGSYLETAYGKRKHFLTFVSCVLLLI